MSNQKRSLKGHGGNVKTGKPHGSNTGKGFRRKIDPSKESKPRTQFDLLKPLHAAMDGSDLTATQRLILMTLHFWMDGEGKCYPSYKTIAERASLHRSTVVRNMLLIVKQGWLTYDKGDSATARPNTYYLNLSKLCLEDGRCDNDLPIIDLKSIFTFEDAQLALESDGSLFTFTQTVDEQNGYNVEHKSNGGSVFFRSQLEIDLLTKITPEQSTHLAMLRAVFVQGERKKRMYKPAD